MVGRRPAVPLVVSLMTGLALGDRIPEPFPSLLPWLCLALFSALFLLTALFRSLALWTGCAFFLVTGLCLTTWLSPKALSPPVPSHLLGAPQRLSGEILEGPRPFRDRVRFIVRLTAYQVQGRDYPAQGKILLTVKTPPPASLPLSTFIPGDPVRFVCSLEPVEGYGNPGGFDPKRNLARQGIKVLGFVEDPELIVLSGPNPRPRWLKKLSILRQHVLRWIDHHVSFPASSLARAVLTGDQSQIPREIQEAYARAGVSHLLAFSGLNLSLVAGFSYFLFRWTLSLSERLLLTLNVRKWALVASFFPVFAYALLAGLNPPAVRAFLMVTLAVLALLLRRYSDLLNSLALAALILLLIAPDALFGPSFQLSFTSVWAIAHLLPRLWNPEDKRNTNRPGPLYRLGYYLWGTFAISLVCQLATAPLVIRWFHQVSLIGLFSNLLLVPLTGALITPVGLFGLIVAPLSPAFSSLIFSVMDVLLRFTLWAVQLFSSLPLAYLSLPRPAWPEIALFFVFLTLIFHHRQTTLRAFWLPLTAGAVLFFYFLPHLQEAIERPLRVHFLDVGRGSAVLLELPKGEKVLIDGGGSLNPDFDLGERVVAPFLWSKKISRLDLVVLTHPHPDHLNGLPYILSRFQVKEVWSNGDPNDTDPFLRFREWIQRKRIPWICPLSDYARPFGGGRIEVLQSPCGGKGPFFASTPWSSENNRSLVLRIVQGREAVLLPADLEAEGEQALLARSRNLRSRILQVPHHGSLTSSTEGFIRAVQPTWAVVSSRYSPRSPLPHPEIIKRYEQRGVKILRTDEEGLITFTLKNGRWEVESRRRGRITAF